jgi:hypothetical protein
MKVSSIRKGVVFAIVAGTFAMGCELIVDFDRTKIPVESNDGAVIPTEASTDAPLDTNQPETATDAGNETSTTDAADAADSADAPDGD